MKIKNKLKLDVLRENAIRDCYSKARPGSVFGIR